LTTFIDHRQEQSCQLSVASCQSRQPAAHIQPLRPRSQGMGQRYKRPIKINSPKKVLDDSLTKTKRPCGQAPANQTSGNRSVLHQPTTTFPESGKPDPTKITAG
jgi:hypothetical protein